MIMALKRLQAIAETRSRIELAAKRLGLDAMKLMREYGVTVALAEMLEQDRRERDGN